MGFELNATPKVKHPRNKQKQAARGKFSKATIEQIFIYDNYLCACCKSNRIEEMPHHIIFKSQMGLGTFENGATVCGRCHRWAHCTDYGPNDEAKELGKQWFEDYRIRKLEGMK